jgi:hypothetical protein
LLAPGRCLPQHWYLHMGLRGLHPRKP